MLKSLYIKNFILIDELFLEFDRGVNVFTGETGAGKTIIIKAIDVVFGAKCSREMPKNPEQKALIEATFESGGKEVIISREISQTGTKSRVDGALVNLDSIKELRETILDIHSQHQTYTFMQKNFHIKLLDKYIEKVNPEFNSLILEYQEEFCSYKKLTEKIENLRENNSEISREIEFLNFQIKEIEDLALSDDEEDNLKSELEVLSNTQGLKEVSYGAYYNLRGGDDNICDIISKIQSNISHYASLDSNLEEINENFANLKEELSACAEDLREYSENLNDNPQRFDEVNERLSQIEKLKRKYGNDIQGEYEKLTKKLQELSSEDNNLEELENKLEILKNKIENLAREISKNRHKEADILSELIENKLKTLELDKAKFKIDVKDKVWGMDGGDDVEFLISTNISQDLAPLIKVASGGEISRIMLGIKTVFADVDKTETIIFDEIDTGISGKTSQAVAIALGVLGETTQVIIVTHQAIIASKANRHFWVSKSHTNETKIQVEMLEGERKLEALAQLTSGDITDKSLDLAKELLNS